MKTQQVLGIVMTLCLLLAVAMGRTLAQEPEPGSEVTIQAAVGTTITYQGRLSDGSGPVSGTCDFTLGLYDAEIGGTLLGSDSRTDVPVSDGYFTLTLNRSNEFGTNPFTGQARWLEITVNCGGGDTLLSPRQPLTAAPYAHYALAAPWSGLSGVPSGLDDGDDDTLADLACSTGQITEWDGGDWVCGEDDVGGGAVHDHWGESWTGTGTGLTLSGGSTGLYGRGSMYGVHGYSTSTNGRGVYGVAGAESGYTYGVYGQNISTTGAGVFGAASAASGYTDAVRGENRSSTGRGVYGLASATTGVTYGVRGFSNSDSGYGVSGVGNTGVHGISRTTSGRGVHGTASATSGTTYGIYGESASTDGRGVYGLATATSGFNYGLYGRSASVNGRGVFGVAPTYGVYGYGDASSGHTYGVWGESSSPEGRGGLGLTIATSGESYGVFGRSTSTSGRGVYGVATTSSGDTEGVIGQVASASGEGVEAINTSSSPTANIILACSTATSSGDCNNIVWWVRRDGSTAAQGSVRGGGSDYADMVPVVGDPTDYTTGDVLVIGPRGTLEKSSQPNSTAVAGVYSSEPAFVGDPQALRDKNARSMVDSDGQGTTTDVGEVDDRVPVALAGVVPTKVSAENGAIRPGDLLTTSSMPGHAMKATPTMLNDLEIHIPGTILGKAMASLETGTGVIQVLVMLQ